MTEKEGYKFEKMVKDGKVAVLISSGYGAGWYTWNSEHEGMLFDADMVAALLEGDKDKVCAIAEERYDDPYTGGIRDLAVVWVDQGDQFEVDEYDGSESLHVIGGREYITA